MHERQWLIANPIMWVVLPLPLIAIAAGLATDGTPPASELAILGGVLLLMGLIASARLDVRLEGDALRIVYFPFWKRTIALHEIAGAAEEEFHPIRDHGGYGIRFGRGYIAYTTHGSQGVHLTLKNHRNLLLGSQNPREWSDALARAGVPVQVRD